MTQENERQIEEMLRDAEKAKEPGELGRNKVVHKGDADAPPMIGRVESAGYTKVYDTKTGVPV